MPVAGAVGIHFSSWSVPSGSGVEARDLARAIGVFARKYAAVRDEVGGDLFEHDAHVLAAGAERLDGGIRHELGEAAALIDGAPGQEFDSHVRHTSTIGEYDPTPLVAALRWCHAVDRRVQAVHRGVGPHAGREV